MDTKDERKFLHDIATPLTVALFQIQRSREMVTDPETQKKLEKAEQSLQKVVDALSDRRAAINP